MPRTSQRASRARRPRVCRSRRRPSSAPDRRPTPARPPGRLQELLLPPQIRENPEPLEVDRTPEILGSQGPLDSVGELAELGPRDLCERFEDLDRGRAGAPPLGGAMMLVVLVEDRADVVPQVLGGVGTVGLTLQAEVPPGALPQLRVGEPPGQDGDDHQGDVDREPHQDRRQEPDRDRESRIRPGEELRQPVGPGRIVAMPPRPPQDPARLAGESSAIRGGHDPTTLATLVPDATPGSSGETRLPVCRTPGKTPPMGNSRRSGPHAMHGAEPSASEPKASRSRSDRLGGRAPEA